MDSASDIARALAMRAEAFCRAYLPNGTLAGNYWKVGDVTGATGRSLAVRLRESYGKPSGNWVDFATSEHGDLLDLIPHVTGAKGFREVMDEARAFLRNPQIHRNTQASAAPAATPAERIERARRLWAFGRPIGSTPAETYLRNRGISRFGSALAWHDSVYYRDVSTTSLASAPALLAKIADGSGNLTGVARTWLDIGRGAVADIIDPKRVMGQLMGHAVRFGNPSSSLLAVGEGIETVLSVGSALPKLSLVACLSATHLGLFEVPDAVRELWILKDNDAAGARAAAHLRERLADRDIVIHEVEPVLGDFNDDLGAWGSQALFERFCHDFGEKAARLADGG